MGRPGLEPGTNALKGRCSTDLATDPQRGAFVLQLKGSRKNCRAGAPPAVFISPANVTMINVAAAIMKLLATVLCTLTASLRAADFDLAAGATNHLGIDLHRQLARGEENVCLSPYSIQTALEMPFGCADGDTRREMARVLHFPNDGDAIHSSFTALQRSLEEMSKKTATIAEQSKKEGGPSEPITLAIANRLFAQRGYDFR